MRWPFLNDTGAIVRKLARRSVAHEKRRNIMMIAAIALSAFLMSMCTTAALSLQQVQKTMSQDTYEAVYTKVTKQDLVSLWEQPEIERVGLHYMIGTFPDIQGYTASVTCFDETMLYEGRAQIQLTEGSLPVVQNEIAADARFLEQYAAGASIGDTISLSFGELTYDFVISAVVNTPDTGTKDYGFLVSEKFLTSFPDFDQAGYRAYVHFRNADALSEEALKQMAAEVGERLGMDHISYHSAYFSRKAGLSVENFLVLAVLAILILFGGSIVIQSIFRISVSERIKSFGQLRTLGATKKQIKGIVSREGRRLSGAGIPIGIAGGIAAGTILTGGSIAGGFHPVNAMIVAAVVTMICLLLVRFSIRKPVRIAASASPMEAVRFSSYQGTAIRKTGRTRRITPFWLAFLNAGRDRKKAVSTLLSLSFGGLLLLLSASLFGSYSPEQNARLAFPNGDFKIYVDSEEDMSEVLVEQNPLTQELRREVLSIDGVREVLTIRNSVGGTSFTNGSAELGGMCDIITAKQEELVRQNLVQGHMPEQDNEVLLPESYAGTVGLGDPLQIQFDCLEDSFSAVVAGFFRSTYVGTGNGTLGLDAAQIMITKHLADRLLPEADLGSYTWEIVTDPAENQVVLSKLNALLLSSNYLSLYTFEEEVSRWAFQSRVVTGGMQGISWLIFLFGIVNMINMTLSNQFARRGEISMIRSVGLTKKQLYQMLIDEGLLFVAGSMGIMLLLGIPASVMVCNLIGGLMYGQPMVYRFPVLPIGIYLLVLLVLVLILSGWSIQNRSKQSLVEQLRSND